MNSKNGFFARSVLGIVAIMVAYFSTTSTITMGKVRTLESDLKQQRATVVENEKNIAVILEKITNIQQMLTEIKENMK